MSKFKVTEEWEGIKLGDVYEEHGVPHKVLYIANPNEPYPILCTTMDGTHTFYNEVELKANMKLIERDGQEVEQWAPMPTRLGDIQELVRFKVRHRDGNLGVLINVQRFTDVNVGWIHWEACGTHSIEPLIEFDYQVL